MTLTARPTTYNGIQMRSRLEATVASNLDEIGVRWSYEPGAFGGRGMQQWVPDFRVELGAGPVLYIEVKGSLHGVEALGTSVERRRALQTRMAVVWDSEPDAILVIAEAQWRFDERNPWPGSVWAGERATGWVTAVFGQCPSCRVVRLLPFKVPVPDPVSGTPGRAWGPCCKGTDRFARPVDLLKRVG